MSEKLNRLAVSYTDTAVLRMNWFFRAQEVSDFGIDAQIEKFSFEPSDTQQRYELASGRLLALQIKGGPSYFAEPSPDGWWFRFDEKKHRYWRDHALPVIVVLCDLDAQVAYWQIVAPHTVTSTGANYKLEVPRSNRLDQADDAWGELASGLERIALAQFGYALSVLPPAVSELLTDRELSERGDAALVATHMAQGRSNPGGTVRALLNATPAWLVRAGSWGYAALGNYAAAHHLQPEAAQAYSESGNLSERGRRAETLIAAAVSHLNAGDPASARWLVETADSEAADADDDKVIRAVGRTMLARPSSRSQVWLLDPALTSLGEEVTGSAPALRVLALHAEHRHELDTAVDRAREALNADPRAADTMELLARLLVQRWTFPNAPATDLRASVDYLREAIVERKPWAGPVLRTRTELARILMLAGRTEEVVELTLPLPYGRCDEAGLDPECFRIGLTAAAHLGRGDVVRELQSHLGDAPADRLFAAQLG